MTVRLGVATVIVTFGIAISAAVAQARPNFSGTWTLVDPPETGGVMFVGLAFIAEQNDKTLTVTPNLAPTATITSPASGATYAGGMTISYSGTGSDPEDGALPASAYEWEVVLHHETHTHPFIAPTSGATGGSFVVPTTGHTEEDVWYRIHLTVTDSDGLTHSVFRDILPRLTTLTFQTSPPGLQITLDGQPLQLTSYEFALLRVLADHAGRVLSRERLLELAKGNADEAFDRSIDVRISRLRQKLGDDPRHPVLLKTVRGSGYLLSPKEGA